MAEIDLGMDGLERFEKIGAGGFATVYAAWDARFQRWVAVKVLDSLDDGGRRRFEREQGLMGQFDDHPHIVTPYRAGYTATGSPYLVMEYLRGGSLEDLMANGAVPVARAVDLIVPIAHALGRAHAGGVLHRDVKPANILLTADGLPKLTDFGIATLRGATVTRVSFTLAHSPPEVFAGGQDVRDERSDLYSLASTLYGVVTRRTPFQADGVDDSQLAFMRRIETEPVPTIGHVGLDRFFVSAMAKDPSARPANAECFIAALHAAMSSSPTPGAPPPPTPAPPRGGSPHNEPPSDPATAIRSPDTAAQVKWGPPSRARGGIDRRWFWAGSAVVMTVVVVAGLIVFAIPPGGSGPETANVDESASASDERQARGADAPGDSSSGETADPPSVLDLPIVYKGHDSAVQALVQLDDGRIASGGYDETVHLWDPDGALEPAATYDGHTDIVWSATIIDDGLVATSSHDGTIQIWDPADATTTIATYRGHTDAPWSLVQLDDGLIASGGQDETVRIWDPDNPSTTIATYNGHTGNVRSLVQLNNGLIASAADDATVQIWDPADPTSTIDTYDSHTDLVWQLVLLENGLIASASYDTTVRIWDPANPETTIAAFDGHASSVLTVVELDNGLMASGSADETVHIWDPDNPNTTIATFDGHNSRVESMIQLDNGLIASGAEDGTVQIWDPDDP